MLKVLVGLAVVAVLAGLAATWARDKGESLLQDRFDASLPGKVDGHAWTPVRHDQVVRADRVRFADGRVTTVRCHQAVGTYSVRVDHRFSFSPAAVAIRKGCPGRFLRASLEHATRVDLQGAGTSQEMTLTDTDGHTVATLRSRGD